MSHGSVHSVLLLTVPVHSHYCQLNKEEEIFINSYVYSLREWTKETQQSIIGVADEENVT